MGSYTKYGEFMDGQDSYWYGISNEPNAGGNATLAWVKINKKEFSITEGEWTLSNAKTMDVGKREKGSYPQRYVKCCVRNGFLYVMAYDTVIHTAGDVKLEDAATPLFRYKEFLVGWGGSRRIRL